MRLFTSLVLATLVGCSFHTRQQVFNIRSADVVTASAEPLDKNRLSANTNAPDFKAQIHIVLNEDGARRFQRFTETHAGQDYELQVNGKVLLPAVGAWPVEAREMWWFTSSMEEAQRFAASLKKK